MHEFMPFETMYYNAQLVDYIRQYALAYPFDHNYPLPGLFSKPSKVKSNQRTSVSTEC